MLRVICHMLCDRKTNYLASSLTLKNGRDVIVLKELDFIKIPRITVSDEVFRQMKQRIVNGSWKSGDKLPSEEELCKQFNVSRVSVRSALNKLQGESLTITRQGKGSFVAKLSDIVTSNDTSWKMDLSKKEYIEIIEFRRAIEFRAIELAVRHNDRILIDEIYQSLQKMIESRYELSKYIDYDIMFHLNVVKASKNDLFYEVLYNSRNILHKCFTETSIISGLDDSKQFSIENHSQIYNNISNGDAEGAKAVIEASMNRNLIHFENKFKN